MTRTPAQRAADRRYNAKRQNYTLPLAADERALLDALADRWGCTKKEAIMRAIREVPRE